MAETERVQIDTSTEVHNPTLEEEYAAQTAASSENEEQNPDRPDWLDDKFESPEDLAKAYKELQTKMSSGEAPEDTAEATQEAAEELVSDAGLNFDALSSEYWENGGLSDASYEQLEAAGIPRELVDQYAQGQEAVVAAAQQQVYSSVGGEEAYQEMIGWAADNMQEGEIDAFNAAVNSGDMNQTMMAIEGLKARYSANGSQEPERSIGGQPVSGGSAYRSTGELMRDMNDPRYTKDAAFRTDVEQKLARSKIF